MIHPHIAALLSHPATRAAIEHALAARGQHGDTQIAHVSPDEMSMLRQAGGVGTRNPSTGLPQFYGAEGGSSPDAGGQGLGSGAGTGDTGLGQGAGGNAGLGGGILGGLRDFIGGGGLIGAGIRGIGNALGPSRGVAGGYGAASLGGNRGLGGSMSGDRSSGALNRWYQIADALQQQQQAQPSGGGTQPQPMPQSPAPIATAPMMSTTAGQDLTGGAFGSLPSWATQPYLVGADPTSYPVPYAPSQPPPQLYGGSGTAQGGAAGTLQSVLSGQGQMGQGQPLTPQQGWQRDLAQRLGLTPQMIAQMWAQQGGQ